MKFKALANYHGEDKLTVGIEQAQHIAIPTSMGGDNVGVSPLKLACSSVAGCLSLLAMNFFSEEEMEGFSVDVIAEKVKGLTSWLRDWTFEFNFPNCEYSEQAQYNLKMTMKYCPMELDHDIQESIFRQGSQANREEGSRKRYRGSGCSICQAEWGHG